METLQRGTRAPAARILTTALILICAACPRFGGTSHPSDTGGTPPRNGGGAGVSTSGGGTNGGATGNAGTMAGSCADALVCEDFESYAPGNAPAAPWKISTNLGTVRVDTTHASSGTKAVRFTTDGSTGTYRRAFMSIEGAPVFPVPGNSFYGRMMVWLAAAPVGSVHWTNIQGEGPVPNMNFRAFSRYGGQHQKRLMANYETQGAASDCWQHSTTTMPEGRWTCMEWRFNGPNNEMNFWLDGTSVSEITVVGRGEGCISQGTAGNWYAPTYDTIRLGWEHYQQSIAHEMWIDDVVIDVKRIGCPPAP